MGINRGTVLDLINDVHNAGGFSDYNSYSYLFDQVDTMPESKTDAEPHWISVEDKMPDNNTDVLLQFSSNMGVGFYEDGDWAVNTGDRIYSEIGYNEEKPIAWMPLPEPYKGVTE